LSQAWSGRKYSIIARPDISRVPVKAPARRATAGGAHRQHRVQARPDLLVAVEGAAVERARPAGLLAGGLVELELEDPGEEVAGVGTLAGHVIFGAGIEIGLGARHRRSDALILQAKVVPALLVLARRDSPLNTRQRHLSTSRPKGRKATLSIAWRSSRPISLSRDGTLLRAGADLDQIFGRDDSAIMSPIASWKAVVGAVEVEQGLLVVGALVVIVARARGGR
jgi:hypothetical protein